MKKLIILSMMIVNLQANIDDLNITNNCEGLKIYDVVWKVVDKNWAGERTSFLQYALKNTTDKNLTKVILTTYLKDKSGNRIMEEAFSVGTIKAHYIKPIRKSSYTGISPAPVEFLGKGDLVITCEKTTIPKVKSEKKEKKTVSVDFEDIKIPIKLYDAIKNKTETKSNVEARIYILKILVNSVEE